MQAPQITWMILQHKLLNPEDLWQSPLNHLIFL